MDPLKLYGLKNCDTCRKALAQLRAADIAHQFVDYRAQPIGATTLSDWAQQLGGFAAMINRSSTTWRQLPAASRNPATEAQWLQLLADFPALLKRPLVLVNGRIQIGLPSNSVHPD
jgi:Spx/MgsR family transcriptional regulator